MYTPWTGRPGHSGTSSGSSAKKKELPGRNIRSRSSSNQAGKENHLRPTNKERNLIDKGVSAASPALKEQQVKSPTHEKRESD